MKPKHTPGPWRVEETDSPCLHIKGKGTAIAFVPRQSKMNCRQDARLIAAAPELLEASERLLERLTHFKNKSLNEIFRKQFDDLSLAIAKARGES